MTARVKIRGIYSVALTRLLLDDEYDIVDPSEQVVERFSLRRNTAPHQIEIRDRKDLQGIEIEGDAERLCELIRVLQARLPDAVMVSFQAVEDAEELSRARLEFPGASKRTLDMIRAAVTPTLCRHHLLRIVAPALLERAELELAEHPGRREKLEARIFVEAILLPLEKRGSADIEHIRPSGRRARIRGGLLLEQDNGKLLIERSFSGGKYDGLDIPIERGDYGLTEIQEGAWNLRHAYFAADGSLKGEYYNVNTPVEIYPHGVRYLDLEVDVVRRSGEPPTLIDREKLAVAVKRGAIGKRLEEKALEVARALLNPSPGEP